MDNIYELNGVSYKFQTMPPTLAVPLMTKLGNIIGGLGNIELGDDDSKAKKSKIDSGALNAIIGLLKSLDHKDLMYIIKQCEPFIFVDSKPCIIDQAFTGKLLDMFKVTAKFLRFTFGDFFPDSVADLIKSKIPKM